MIGSLHMVLYLYIVPFMVYPKFGKNGITVVVVLAVLISAVVLGTLFFEKKTREKEMGNFERIEWEKKYSVDVEEIDIHQKKMFELFNLLIDMKTSKTDIKDCINVITEINDYSKLYFSTEEKYLKKKGYPDFNSHAKAHRQFAKISISLRREISENEDSLTLDVIEEMRNWLINHILTRDTLYIPFLRINQYIEDSKKKN